MILKQISINNFVLIEKTTIDLDKGLNVLTGETGAGKSIILLALKITLGEKVSTNQIQVDKDFLEVTSVFDVNDSLEVQTKLKELGVNNDNNLLKLHREIKRDGKSRCYINNLFISVKQLQEVANLIIDIHSQNDNQYLFNNHFHEIIYDKYLGLEYKLEGYKKIYSNFIEEKKKLSELLKNKIKINQEEDFLQYTINELEKKLISEEDYNKIKQKLDNLENTQNIREVASFAYDALEGGARNQIEKTQMKLEQSSLSIFQEVEEKLVQVIDLLGDVKEKLTSYLNDGDYLAEEEIDTLNEKLMNVERIKKKYKKSINELYDYLDESKKKIETIENSEIDENKIKKNITLLERLVSDKAVELHMLRKNGIVKFEKDINCSLADLNMEDSKMTVHIETKRDENDGVLVDEKKVSLSENGFDKIEFVYQPTPESSLQRLKQIASGGEMSRIMLSIKEILLACLPNQVIVLDEIDIGIGGETAKKVGGKMKSLVAKRQLLVITHLPQIAKFADKHFLVKKQRNHNKTLTTIEHITDYRVEEELVRMVGL